MMFPVANHLSTALTDKHKNPNLTAAASSNNRTTIRRDNSELESRTTHTKLRYGASENFKAAIVKTKNDLRVKHLRNEEEEGKKDGLASFFLMRKGSTNQNTKKRRSY